LNGESSALSGHKNAKLFLIKYVGTALQFWLGLQMDFDLDVAEDALAERLERKVRPYAAATA
jgi:plasmid maintenance system antidote protein VapI